MVRFCFLAYNVKYRGKFKSGLKPILKRQMLETKDNSIMFFEDTFENTQWRKVQTYEVISTEYCILLDLIIQSRLRF